MSERKLERQFCAAWKCSVCKAEILSKQEDYKPSYCPRCGSDEWKRVPVTKAKIRCKCNDVNALLCHECEESTGVCYCKCHDVNKASNMSNSATESLPWLDGEQFYNLMQNYRHAGLINQTDVTTRYEAVKSYIRLQLRNQPNLNE